MPPILPQRCRRSWDEAPSESALSLDSPQPRRMSPPAGVKHDPHSSVRAGRTWIAGGELQQKAARMAPGPVEAAAVWDDVQRAGREQPGVVERALPIATTRAGRRWLQSDPATGNRREQLLRMAGWPDCETDPVAGDGVPAGTAHARVRRLGEVQHSRRTALRPGPRIRRGHARDSSENGEHQQRDSGKHPSTLRRDVAARSVTVSASRVAATNPGGNVQLDHLECGKQFATRAHVARTPSSTVASDR